MEIHLFYERQNCCKSRFRIILEKNVSQLKNTGFQY